MIIDTRRCNLSWVYSFQQYPCSPRQNTQNYKLNRIKLATIMCNHNDCYLFLSPSIKNGASVSRATCCVFYSSELAYFYSYLIFVILKHTCLRRATTPTHSWTVIKATMLQFKVSLTLHGIIKRVATV